MKQSFCSTLCSLVFGLAVAISSQASFAEQEFSAETVQRGPDGALSGGKIFIGDGRMRSEMSHQGQQVIRITDQDRGLEWILFPEQKNYMERQLTAPGGQPPAAKPAADDPCAGMIGLSCKRVGEEQVAGRAVVKWEMVANHQGQDMKSTQWIDKERGLDFILRQEMPNGETMERELVGQETLDGRQTEKWKIVMTQPGSKTMSTFEWYDPELELALKQEFPGGMVSELKNVRVGKQADHLFGIPAGYERISMPRSAAPPDQPQTR